MTTNLEDLAALRLLAHVRHRLSRPRELGGDLTERARADEAAVRESAPVLGPTVAPHLGAIVSAAQSLPPFPAGSRRPGLSAVFRMLGRIVRRDTAAISERVDVLAGHTAEALRMLIEHVDRGNRAAALVRATDAERARADVERLSWRQDALEDALIETARRSDERWDLTMSEPVAASIDALRKDLEAVGEVAAATASWVDDHRFGHGFSSLRFVDRFRGSREAILARYHDVAELLLEPGGPVLDLGCGRGELVELVHAKGGVARGVEVDPEQVEYCRSIFLDVQQLDARTALEQTEDQSLGGVALIQVVEHLTPRQLVELLPLVRRKLRPGGVLVAETVNAISPVVYTRSFYLDPTHTNPVHHEYLRFLFEESGFDEVEIRWRALVAEADKIPLIDTGGGEPLVDAVNQRITRLNQFLFCPEDYLVVGRA